MVAKDTIHDAARAQASRNPAAPRGAETRVLIRDYIHPSFPLEHTRKETSDLGSEAAPSPRFYYVELETNRRERVYI